MTKLEEIVESYGLVLGQKFDLVYEDGQVDEESPYHFSDTGLSNKQAHHADRELRLLLTGALEIKKRPPILLTPEDRVTLRILFALVAGNVSDILVGECGAYRYLTMFGEFGDFTFPIVEDSFTQLDLGAWYTVAELGLGEEDDE